MTLFPNTKYRLNNRTLVVLTKQINNKHVARYLDRVLHAMAHRLNFSLAIDHTNISWGLQVNGTWDGLVGELARRRYDMVVTSLTINEDRERVMDFLLPPTFNMYEDIMYSAHGDDRWQLYLKPFRPIVFITLAVILAAFTCIVSALSKWDKSPSSTTGLKGRQHLLLNISEIFFLLQGLLLNRGVQYNPRTWTVRLLLFTWATFSVVVAAVYNANLVAFFTVRQDPLPFRNLADLVKNKEYTWGLIPGTISEHILKKAPSGPMKAAWKGIEEFRQHNPTLLSNNFKDHLYRVLSERYALIVSRATIEREMATHCSLRAVGENIIWHQMGIAVPTKFPLAKILEKELSILTDTGLMDTWWEQARNKLDNKCQQQSSSQSLSLWDVQACFYAMFIGIVVASGVFLAECLYRRTMPMQ